MIEKYWMGKERKLRLTRDVTQEECPWLEREWRQGTIVYECPGPDYGASTENGICCSVLENVWGGPELPLDALEIVDEKEMTMDYPLLLTIAIRLASEHHGDKMNKDGTPYILHPLRLMMNANGYPEQIVAILHDTIEDTQLTLEDLAEAGFPLEILVALDALTKREGEEYEAFIERIALNPLAVRVKLLDLYDNIDVTRLPELGDWELKRTAKYHRAIQRLKQVHEMGGDKPAGASVHE